MADLVLFDEGLVISEDRLQDVEDVADHLLIHIYVNDYNGAVPDGWPSNAAKKELLEWGLKRALKSYHQSAQKNKYEQAYVPPEDLEL
jgi:hypothetical protein